jgi:hypothetical protein
VALLRKRRLLAPILRLATFILVCVAVLGYVDYRAARASVMEHLLGISQRMAPYLDDGRGTEAPRAVRINGVRMYVAAGHTDHPPAFVRKWYTDRYAARGDGLDELGKQLRARGALPADAPNLNQLLFGNDQKGGVAALDYGDAISIDTLRQRLSRFIGGGDLGSIARLRYVYYEKTGAGGTRFLTAWSDDKFELAHLIPTGRRDADGSDIDGVPRFPGTVRVLSAEEHGLPQRLVVYDGPGSPDTATLFYRARMQTLGWSEDETFAALSQRQGKHALKFGNPAGHEVVLDLSSGAGDQGLTVCAIQTR